MPKTKKLWADPNREGRSKGPKGERFCSRCGNTIQTARILKAHNLCEFCVKELAGKRDGVWSCRSCGRIAPEELREHKGYCKHCICSACGRHDSFVKKTGLCMECSKKIGDFCRICGKEASAQVRHNRGLCDACVKKR
ncbi:hypothetical protein EDC14_1012110 [Hydrogenispora ethanolica]|jgi:hypothetical protein|uniref:Uncharacterized protein n=1 Tax=Hydrogenispora ethanolica TaxID=1082276 RepID=A0A4R1RSG0_HYDET|nr:hypothetical protein EDC14_1012110 [Hydrogenispora ethanolica]